MASSPFSAHFDTNYIPSDHEIREISQIILEPQSRVTHLNSEIARLQALIASLTEERNSIASFIDKHLSLITPTRRLPTDVLQEIFFHSLPTDRNPIMSSHETPLLLTRVCSVWRHTAFSTPRLWCRIHIPVPNSHCTFFPAAIDVENYPKAVHRVVQLRSIVVREWLDRSGVCPIDISFNQWDDAQDISHAQPLIDSVLTYRHRWRSISISAPIRYMSKIMDIDPDESPFLEILSLVFNRASSREPDASTHTLMDRGIFKAPKLQELGLVWYREDALKLPVNWSQLTYIALEKISTQSGSQSATLSIARCLDLLSRCPNLVAAKLEVGRDDPEMPEEEFKGPIIQLPHLESLSIHENEPIPELFKHLELPRLRELSFYSNCFPGPTIRNSLLSLLEQVGSQILKFSTNAQNFTSSDLIECFERLPGVAHLAIAQPVIGGQRNCDTGYGRSAAILGDAILTLMTPPSSPLENTSSPREVLLPELQYFEGYSNIGFSDAVLSAFIRNRQRQAKRNLKSHIAKLRKVSIEFNSRPREIDIMPDVIPLIEDGLEVNIVYATQPLRGPFSPADGLADKPWEAWPQDY